MARSTLTREEIVRAAVALLDAEGVEGLSMRRLGSRLDSAATAVYWHVESKDELVVLAGDSVWNEIELPDLTEVGWRDAATAMANDLYAMIVRHPWLVTAMSTHVIYGPGKARHDEHALAVYESAGFAGRDAEQALSVVFTFVLGTALGAAVELAGRTRPSRGTDKETQRVQAMVAQAAEIASHFPRLRARSDDWAEGDPGAHGQDLEFGLQTILAGLEARLSGRPTPEA